MTHDTSTLNREWPLIPGGMSQTQAHRHRRKRLQSHHHADQTAATHIDRRSQIRPADRLALTLINHHQINKCVIDLGMSRRRVYVLLERYRQGTGLVTDLALQRSDGGKGDKRLSGPVEQVIREFVRARYLTRQKRSIASLHRDIRRECTARDLPVPARNTVAARIARLDPIEVGWLREGPESVRGLQSAGGVAPVVESILERVQLTSGPISSNEPHWITARQTADDFGPQPRLLPRGLRHRQRPAHQNLALAVHPCLLENRTIEQKSL